MASNQALVISVVMRRITGASLSPGENSRRVGTNFGITTVRAALPLSKSSAVTNGAHSTSSNVRTPRIPLRPRFSFVMTRPPRSGVVTTGQSFSLGGRWDPAGHANAMSFAALLSIHFFPPHARVVSIVARLAARFSQDWNLLLDRVLDGLRAVGGRHRRERVPGHDDARLAGLPQAGHEVVGDREARRRHLGEDAGRPRDVGVEDPHPVLLERAADRDRDHRTH